jgi:hypothetical protein
MTICTSSSIRTITVGSGIAPDLLTPRGLRTTMKATTAQALAGSQMRVALHTAGGESHPALKTY